MSTTLIIIKGFFGREKTWGLRHGREGGGGVRMWFLSAKEKIIIFFKKKKANKMRGDFDQRQAGEHLRPMDLF